MAVEGLTQGHPKRVETSPDLFGAMTLCPAPIPPCTHLWRVVCTPSSVLEASGPPALCCPSSKQPHFNLSYMGDLCQI